MPQTRLLKIFELVAKLGPVALDNLVVEAGFSRSAVFRALKKLEVEGWIRLRLDGRNYVATSKTEEFINPEQNIFSDIEELVHLLLNANGQKFAHIQVFHQTTILQMKLVDDSEVSEWPTDNQSVVSLCFESLQNSGVVCGSRKTYSFPEELLAKTFKTIGNVGYIENYSQSGFCIPLKSRDNCLTIVHLSQKDGREFQRAEMVEWINDLPSLISGSNLGGLGPLNWTGLAC